MVTYQGMSSNKVAIKILVDDLMTVPDVAKTLGYTKMTLYRWVNTGKVQAIRLGGILFIPKSEIERLRNEYPSKNKPAVA